MTATSHPRSRSRARTARRFGAIAPALCLALGAGACTAAGEGRTEIQPTRAAPSQIDAPSIVVDGRIDDWADGEVARIGPDWIAFRVQLGEAASLGRVPLIVEIDADTNPATGDRVGSGADAMGIELRFDVLGPPGERRRRGPGLTVFEDGEADLLDAYASGAHAAPTHASDTFEFRIDRDAVPGLEDGGRATFRFSLERGTLLSTPRQTVDVPPARSIERDDRIPARPEGAVRVVSWNVLWGETEENPEAFARILRAVRPDVVLIQEWDRGDATESSIAAWFDRHAPWGAAADGGWSVSENDAWGVAIATPHEITARAGDDVRAPGTRWNFPIRMAAAAVRVDDRVIALGSIHYKCCGSLDTEEDVRRLLEANATNETLRELAETSGAEWTILGGDFNLVGRPSVLDVSFQGLDADRSGLVPADAFQLGHPVQSTFGRPDQTTSGPRLDYIGYPDAVASVANAFVVDTHRLSDQTLAAHGLERTDSAASDHLLVVVDLVDRE